MNIKSLSQGITILNDNSILGWNEDIDEILHMTDADSLRKRDAIIDHMKDDCKDIFLRMRDIDSGRMRDESKIFLKNSRMNDELFGEVEDDISWYCNDIIDIPCVRVWICYKNNSEEKEIMMRISSSEIEDEDIRAIEFEGESERSYLCSNYRYDFP